MSSAADHHVEYHLLYKLINAPVLSYPFPHLYAEGIFPEAYYRSMMDSFPSPEQMRPIADERALPKDAYPSRFMLALEPAKLAALPKPRRQIWERLRQFLLGPEFANTLLWKFGDVVKQRLTAAGIANPVFNSEAMLIDDRQNYRIGPHTDNQRKVITVLFYLPKGAGQPGLGTSIYVPNDPNFRCAGGPEHPVERFQRVVTMPYQPNAVFAFVKTDNSFHGVETVTALSARRQLLIFDMYLQAAAARPEATPPQQPKMTFTM